MADSAAMADEYGMHAVAAANAMVSNGVLPASVDDAAAVSRSIPTADAPAIRTAERIALSDAHSG